MQQQQGPRGAFILFEGVDRCGKSTQTSLLAKALQSKGVAVESWNFPDRKNTVTGHAINDDALLRALHSGTSLVVDRYAYSGVAYSAAKALPGMDAAWCKAPDAGLPAPDLVVYLELDNAAAAARAGFGGERYEKAEFQDRVRAVFQQLKEPSWLVVDASQSVEQIHEQILAEALQVVRRCKEGQPIQQLWGAAAAAAGEDRTPLAEQQQQQQAE
ncbi:hypothetical protein OEZ85_012250 [Tetradesmus obliquus]|uniref:dTMP kinase n=1 Tax=Tetradesmus obliquus TaxID=3088 RepID=A0ABY8TSS5_TETOB|nr:hypothetical protein OEZ85_012250 [Tetradesmus obliquus]